MRFSIITINYNNDEGLRHTIESVVCQTYKDYEYIIIDGGSTDRSVSVIEKYANRINYWISERDNGIYNAMNKGVLQASGDYCIFMNSGDILYNNSVLQRIADCHVEEDVIVGKVSIDEDDHIISPPPNGELTLYHLYSGAIPHQGSFIRTSLLRKYPYDETLMISSDWKFFIQTLILDNCPVKYLDIFVSKYNMDGISSVNPDIMRREKDEVLRSLFPPRVLADYNKMKSSECLTQTITPTLRNDFCIDKLLFKLGCVLIKIKHKLYG